MGMKALLGPITGGVRGSEALSVSGDGSIIAGKLYVGSNHDLPDGMAAFVWHESTGIRFLRDVLEDEGVDLTGWHLRQATGVSGAGNVIVGNGINPDGNEEAWIAEIRCDLTHDWRCTAEDIDILSLAVREQSTDLRYDLNEDGLVDADDRAYWVHDEKRTYFGDSNLDRQFNSYDMVGVFWFGQYEDAKPGNSTWMTGDWDGDAEFTSADMVIAFQDGGYETGPRTDVAMVPEPGGWLLFATSLLLWLTRAHFRKQAATWAVLACWWTGSNSLSAAILPGNLLPNPSVELDEDQDGTPDGWSRGGNDPSGDIWDDSRPVSGVRNLLLADTGTDNYTSWYTNVGLPPDLEELEFQWTWSYEFTSENPSDEFRMTVAWQSAGNDISYNHFVLRDPQPEFPDYVTESQTWFVPEGADALRLEFVTGGPQTETGLMYVDDISFAVPGAALRGDFNANGTLDRDDIDQLTAAAAAGDDPKYDLTGDNLVDVTDVNVWVKDLKRTWIGDADVDLEFNSSDFVQVFAVGKYETQQPAVWSEGDWSGDGLFDSGDFVTAFQDGGYEQGPRTDVAAVPEPTSGMLAVLALGLLTALRMPRWRQ